MTTMQNVLSGLGLVLVVWTHSLWHTIVGNLVERVDSNQVYLVWDNMNEIRQKWSVLTCLFFYNFLDAWASKPQLTKDELGFDGKGKEQYSTIASYNGKELCK